MLQKDWFPWMCPATVASWTISVSFPWKSDFRHSLLTPLFIPVLALLVNRCPNLREIDLSDTEVSSEAFPMLRKLEHLEHLSLSRCYNIDFYHYSYDCHWSCRTLANRPPFSFSSCREITGLSRLKTLHLFGLQEDVVEQMKTLMPTVTINESLYSSIARPTFGSERSSIWGLSTVWVSFVTLFVCGKRTSKSKIIIKKNFLTKLRSFHSANRESAPSGCL